MFINIPMIYFLYILFILIFVVIDQIIKSTVVNNIALNQVIVLIRNFFNLTYVRNYGAGFSILQNATVFLSLISIVACVVLFYYLIKTDKKDIVSKISYLLIISGAIGNLIDRLKLGYVIDFLDFKIFGYDFPVFNIADCYITIGCFILIIKVLLESKNARVQS